MKEERKLLMEVFGEDAQQRLEEWQKKEGENRVAIIMLAEIKDVEGDPSRESYTGSQSIIGPGTKVVTMLGHALEKSTFKTLFAKAMSLNLVSRFLGHGKGSEDE